MRTWPRAVLLEIVNPDMNKSGSSTLPSEGDKRGACSPMQMDVEASVPSRNYREMSHMKGRKPGAWFTLGTWNIMLKSCSTTSLQPCPATPAQKPPVYRRFLLGNQEMLSSALITSLNHHAINLSCSMLGKDVLHQTPPSAA